MPKKNKQCLLGLIIALMFIKPNFITKTSRLDTDEFGPVEIEKLTNDTTEPEIEASGTKAITARIPVYHIFNSNSGDSLYTTNSYERDNLTRLGWKDKKTNLYCTNSGQKLFRLFNTISGEHFYTLNIEERDTLKNYSWRYEGIAWLTPQSGQPVYRLYNGNPKGSGAHQFTTLISERDALIRDGWRDEGIAWFTETTKDSTPANLNFLGINRQLIIDELSKHERDSYYLGTPYIKLGTNDASKYMIPEVGMNCTGFVAKVIQNAGGDLTQITKSSDNWGGAANAYNWRNTLNLKVRSYSFNNVWELLKSNKVKKGHIIYFEADYSERNHDCHIGFFWGDSPSDNQMWHSAPSENKIGKLYSPAGYSKIIVYSI